MTYRAQEDSQQSGEVVELYAFTTALGRTLLTSGNQPISYATELYEPGVVSRSRVTSESQEESKQELQVTLPRDHPIPLRYVSKVPALEDSVAIYRGQVNDSGVTTLPDGTITLPASAVITYFRGVIATVSFSDSEAELHLVGLSDVLDRIVPARTYRNLCNHVLYDSHCQVDPSSFQYSVTVTAFDGRDVTVTGVPAIGGSIDAAFFDGGILLQQTTSDARMVQTLTRHNGTSTIEVLLPFEALAVDDVLLLRAGCDHSIDTCRAKFSNARRYGGFPTVPTKNVFTTRLG